MVAEAETISVDISPPVEVATPEAIPEPTPAPSRFKIPPRRVPAHDCPVVVGRVIKDGVIAEAGETYYPHVNEWVEVLPVGSMRTWFALSHLRTGVRAGEKADDNVSQLQVMEGGLTELCAQLAKRVTAWNWTDLAGEALPQPYGNPQVLMDLETDELLWLLLATRGETPAERKNG